ncbi:MAG: hypothetical protein JXR73_14790 [Candidatus Omnitrophica bacterium]|nr:hypothetical protein [Candidatus Omnitrophota bacterium]
MNGLIPPPDSLGIPSPPVIFHFLSILTFVLHVIFMNYVLGGSIMVAVHEWLFGSRDHAGQANSLMIRIMPVALSMAITMGVAPLLFVQVIYGQFFYIANVLMGAFWLSIIGLVMAAFYIVYILIAKRPVSERASGLTRVGVLLNALLFLLVAFIYTNNAILTENPQYWADIHSGRSWVVVPDASLWPRYLHNVIGAIAIAGLWCAVIGRYQIRYHEHRAEAGRWMVKMGLHWAAAATTFEILIGVLFLYTLGMDKIKDFMGNGILFVGWSISLMTSLIALICMIMAMMKPDNPKLLWGSIGLTVATLFGMAMGRLLLRMISLENFVQELTIRPSHSSLLLFLVTFIAGLAVLAYLIRLAWTLPDRTDASEA